MKSLAVALLLMIFAGCAGASGVHGNHEALLRMAAAAGEASRSLDEMNDIRPRTPEWLMLRLEWRKKELEARLALTDVRAEREKLLAAYVGVVREMAKAVEVRVTIDAPTASLGEAQFALAEGEYWLAREKNPECDHRDLLLGMKAKAEMTVQGIVDIEAIRPRSPEFGILKLEWQRRVFAVKLALATTDAERVALANDNLTMAKANVKEFEQRTDQEYGPFSQSYFLAWGEYEMEKLAGTSRAFSTTRETLLTNAEGFVRQLDETASIRPNTPEFLSLRLTWLKTRLDAQLLMASSEEEKLKDWNEYAARLRMLREELRGKNEFPGAERFLDYALAEAEYRQSMPT